MPVAALFDIGGDHTATMRAIFGRGAPVGWTVAHYNTGALGPLPVAEAIADGAALIVSPNPVGALSTWDAARDAGVPVVSAHASNGPDFVDGYVGWPVVVSAAHARDTTPSTSYGGGVELTVRPAQTVTQSWACASAAAAMATLLDHYGNAWDARSALRSLAVSTYDWEGVGLVDLRNVPALDGAELLSASEQTGVGFAPYLDGTLTSEPSSVLPGGTRIFGTPSSGSVPLLATLTPGIIPTSGDAIRLRGDVHNAGATPMLFRHHAWDMAREVAPGATVDADLVGGYLSTSNEYQTQIRGTVEGAPMDVHVRGLSMQTYPYTATPLPATTAPPQPPLAVTVEGGVIRWLPWAGADYAYTEVAGQAAPIEGELDALAIYGPGRYTVALRTVYAGGLASDYVIVTVDVAPGVPGVPVADFGRRDGRRVDALCPATAQATTTIRLTDGAQVVEESTYAAIHTRGAVEMTATTTDNVGRTATSTALVPGLPTAEPTIYLP